MANVDTTVKEEIDEIKNEYEALLKEAQAEIDAAPSVNTTEMHIFNIAFAAVMIIIGAVLVYQTRNIQLKNGKKIAGWILLILGGLAFVTHIIQLIF